MIESRIKTVRARMIAQKIDALMVLIEENRRYLSGFTGEDHQFDESAGALIITADNLVLATDSRFETQAADEAPMFELVIYRQGLAKELPALMDRLDVNKLGFESVRVSVQQRDTFEKALADADVKTALVPLENMVEALREIKSDQEVELTRKALAMAEEAFVSVVKTLKPGMTEKQIAWAMESGLHDVGADGLSFPVILASGPNSALPHAIPTDRSICEGEPILFDWGVKLDGYCSDTSRTVILGKPDEKFLTVYHTVLEAQQMAIQAIRAGANTKNVDAVARNHIASKGFGDKFGHGLGHGTGLAVHEGPRLSPLRETILETGMVVTVEPGIYLPGWGGVRIENQVVVQPEGALVLNRLGTDFEPNLL